MRHIFLLFTAAALIAAVMVACSSDSSTGRFEGHVACAPGDTACERAVLEQPDPLEHLVPASAIAPVPSVSVPEPVVVEPRNPIEFTPPKEAPNGVNGDRPPRAVPGLGSQRGSP